jgi:hypothetical protein
MRKESWPSWLPACRPYRYTQAVTDFIERVVPGERPLALILFGSLARGDYHECSDADFCVVLPEAPDSFFAGYARIVAYSEDAVQPFVYGPHQFRQMVRQANGLVLDVMADGLFLGGDESFRLEVEQLAAQTREYLGIERTPNGWLIARPEYRYV